ncbi:MAG: hypothetical protein ACR2LC_08025 [Pyrinomonadaceae bacterium]
MTLKQKIRCYMLLLLICSAAAFVASAQTPATATDATTTTTTTGQPQKTSEQQALERKALALLDELAGGADTLRLPENRALVRASIADILWTHDEKRARALFKDAIFGISETTPAAADDADESFEMGFGMMAKQMKMQLRSEVLQMIASHDARLALEYLRATRPPASSAATLASKRYGLPDTESQTELSLAEQMATSEPKQALEVAEESLSRGISPQLPDIVLKLEKKDHEAAAKLATDIVKKLRTENLTSDNESAVVAVGLLQMKNGSGKDAAPILNKQAMQDLANMLATAALSLPSGKSYYLNQFESALPDIEKYAPARAAEVRRKIAAFKKRNEAAAATADYDGDSGGDDMGIQADYQKALEKGTADDIIALSAKASPEMRNMMIQQAASKTLTEGNADRARSIINEKITDPAERKQMLAELDRQALASAVEKGKIEDARQSLTRVRSNDARAAALAALAINAKEKGQQKLAQQLLDESRGAINPRPRNLAQLAAQFQVALAAALVDPAHSFVVVEPMVDQLNELVNAATVLGGFIAPEFIRDDEAMMSFASKPIALLSAQYNKELSALLSTDFERTKAVADRFQRNELRILARLLIARNVLAPPAATEEDKTTATDTHIVVGP